MNRRAFIKLLSAAAMVPVIGLPAIAPGAPVVETNCRYIVYLGKRIYFCNNLAQNSDEVFYVADCKNWDTILAGTMMVYADDDCRTVKPAALESASFPHKRRQGTASPVKQSEGMMGCLW